VRPRLLDLFCGAGGAAMGYHRAGFDVVGVDIKPQPHYPFTFIRDNALDFLVGKVIDDHSGLRTLEQADALEILRRSDETNEIREAARNGLDGLVRDRVVRCPSRLADPPAGFVLASFDAIHASPPCQRWSSKTRNGNAHPDLITPLRPLLEATGLPYVIENVEGAPLDNPIMLCGSSFGLGVERHRLFESNVPLMAYPCAHGGQPRRYRLYDHGDWYMSRIVHVFGTGGGKGREHWQEAMGIDWTNDTDELREAIPPAYTELVGHQLLQHIQVAA
jgi:hypothetical protein